MALFEIGQCRVCGKNCLWMPIVDGVLAFFEVCTERTPMKRFLTVSTLIVIVFGYVGQTERFGNVP